MFSYKFAAYFQNTFPEEHLRRAASHIFLVIFSPWKSFLRSCWKTHNCKVLHHDIWWLRNFSCTLFFLRTIFFAHFFDKLIQINLRRYDTIKISLKFPEFFIIGNYVKTGLKTGGHHAIFRVLEVKRSKNITKIEQKILFLFTLLISFFMSFLVQKLIYKINILFNFVFGSFFEQDHLWNWIILGVYAKRWPKWARISLQKMM